MSKEFIAAFTLIVLALFLSIVGAVILALPIGLVGGFLLNQGDYQPVSPVTMPIVILVAIIILAEKLTGMTAQELVGWVLLRLWDVIRGIFTFLIDIRMFEPPGSRS
jgi:hypothetical protein